MKIPIILLVDDESGQRDNIKSYVEPRAKCVIAEAGSAEEAISYLKNNSCDIMVLDIRMPGGSGMEVLDVTKDLSIATIVFTGWDSEQVYNKCKEHGVKAYIPKSDSIKVIGDRIIKELKEKKLYRKV